MVTHKITIYPKMKNKIIFLLRMLALISIILSLSILAFAQFQQPPYADSENVACGNSVCERAIIELKIGEEKNIDIGGKTHKIKLTQIEKVPEGGSYDY